MLIARIRVVLSAAVTWLVTAAAVVTILVAELGSVAGVPPAVVHALGTALVVITVATTIIRRVTVVLPEARGILPTGHPNSGLEAVGAAALRNAHRRQHPAETAAAETAAGGELEQFPGEFA